MEYVDVVYVLGYYTKNDCKNQEPKIAKHKKMHVKRIKYFLKYVLVYIIINIINLNNKKCDLKKFQLDEILYTQLSYFTTLDALSCT